MAKEMKGLYHIKYQVWLIEFPYMGEKFFYAGPRSGAETALKKIQRAKRWPYGGRIRVIVD